MSIDIHIGDCRDVLKTLPDESVHCVVTSPPYWRLRTYGGGPKELGFDKSPEEWLYNMGCVFEELRRILRNDGTLWLNLGDTYYQKQLIGLPWRFALQLQSSHWYLRRDIIWHKPSAMPEGYDRPTTAHEYIFMLSKSMRYFYDWYAIREPIESGPSDIKKMVEQKNRLKLKSKETDDPLHKATNRTNIGRKRAVGNIDGRNARSVWTIPTQGYHGAHFATFPEELARRCIKAGTSEKGCCPECRAPWKRITEKTGGIGKSWHNHKNDLELGWRDENRAAANAWPKYRVESKGWQPTCQCFEVEDSGYPGPPYEPIKCTVLDPFAGAGTTGLVADQLGRNAILIELNLKYAEMAKQRIQNACPMFAAIRCFK